MLSKQLSQLKKIKEILDTAEKRLQNFLFNYRNMPNSIGMSPNEMVFKQRPTTRFDFIKPSHMLEKKIQIYINSRIFAVG